MATREPSERPLRKSRQPDEVDRLFDRRTVLGAHAAKRPDGGPTCGHDLAKGRGRLDADRGALRQIAEPGAVAQPLRRLAEQEHPPRGRPQEPECKPKKRGLAAAVRAGDRHELSGLDPQVDIAQGGLSVHVREVDVFELDG